MKNYFRASAYYVIATLVSMMVIACDDDEYTPNIGIPDMTNLTIDNQFPIIAWTGIDYEDTFEKMDKMKDCGINIYLGWYDSFEKLDHVMNYADKNGEKLIVQCEELLSSPETIVPEMMKHPSLFAYYIEDEIEEGDFAKNATVINTISSIDSKHPCYINLYPNWAWGSIDSYEYKLVSYVSSVPVKFLSFDQYPIIQQKGEISLREYWYKNLEDIRRVSRAKNMPFWAFALSLSHQLGDILYPVPTLGHIRLQMFSNLAYGAQGFQYFTYWGIFHDEPTEVYDIVKTVNKELQSLSKIFLGASIDGVWHTGSNIPYGTKALKEMPRGISSIKTSDSGALVSHIVNKGKEYVAIVNKSFDKTMDLSISFDKTTGKIDKSGNSTTILKEDVTVDPGDIVIYQLNE